MNTARAHLSVNEGLWYVVGSESESASVVKVRWLRRFWLLATAVHAWVLVRQQVSFAGEPASAILLVLCFVVGWRDRFARLAASGALLLLVGHVVATFPQTHNHMFLNVVVLGLIVFLREDVPVERQRLLQAARGLVIIVCCWAGLQKLLHGYYFRGTFFAYAMLHSRRFGSFFSMVAPADESARLTSLDPTALGSGPWVFESPSMLLLCNGVVFAEILIPLGLLHHRTRRPSVAALIALLVCIELAAHEFVFGMMYAYLAVLFLSAPAARRAFFFGATLFGVLLIVGLAYPQWWFN